MYSSDYIDVAELDEGPYEQESSYYQPGRSLWLFCLVCAAAIIVPFSFLFLVSRDHLTTCLLAYVNCLIILFAIWRFLRKGTLALLIPVVFIPYLFLAWPINIILFAVFYPDYAYYSTTGAYISFFDAGVKVQMCTMVFVAVYFSVVSLFLRHDGRMQSERPANKAVLGPVAIVFSIGIFVFTSIAALGLLPYFLRYLAYGFYKYLNGLIFIVGCLFKRFSLIVKLAVLALIALGILFFTVGNARGMALRCIAFFVLGILIFSGYSRKTKIIIILSLCLVFPAYVTISNTTRTLLGSIGFEEGFEYRLKALGEWKQVTAEQSFIVTTFGRLFFTGGHAIIARTPEQMPYRSFKARLILSRSNFDAGGGSFKSFFVGIHTSAARS